MLVGGLAVGVRCDGSLAAPFVPAPACRVPVRLASVPRAEERMRARGVSTSTPPRRLSTGAPAASAEAVAVWPPFALAGVVGGAFFASGIRLRRACAHAQTHMSSKAGAGIFSSDRNRKVEERRRKRKRFRNKQEAVWRDPHYSTAVYSVDVDRHVVVAVCTAAAAAGHSTPFPIDNDKQMLHETRSGISKREMPARQILLLVKLNLLAGMVSHQSGLESVEDVLDD